MITFLCLSLYPNESFDCPCIQAFQWILIDCPPIKAFQETRKGATRGYDVQIASSTQD